LDAQGGVEGDEDALLADELHFIIVHQTYELWFKLVLRSMRLARDHLAQPHVSERVIPHVVHHLRRINSILRLGVHQFEVMETLTTQGFLAFRDKLVPASGFQSFQMRELEILMGLEDSKRIRLGNVDPLQHIAKHAGDTPGGRLATSRLARARSEDTLLAVLHKWLGRTPIRGSTPSDPGDAEVVQEFIDDYLRKLDEGLRANEATLLANLGAQDPEAMHARFEGIRKAATAFLNAEDVADNRPYYKRVRASALFIESYRELPLLAWPRLLIDLVLELEEQLVLWRHRHARMVERVIGRRVGTGGSGGVDYLDKTGAYRVFRDLWSIRTMLLRADGLPNLDDPGFYGFTST
jgi:tryptophan 2,3-dioxygenase